LEPIQRSNSPLRGTHIAIPAILAALPAIGHCAPAAATASSGLATGPDPIFAAIEEFKRAGREKKPNSKIESRPASGAAFLFLASSQPGQRFGPLSAPVLNSGQRSTAEQLQQPSLSCNGKTAFKPALPGGLFWWIFGVRSRRDCASLKNRGIFGSPYTNKKST
jgi:hypothetical protein